MSRSTFSDWIGDHETKERKLVNLDYLPLASSGALAQHPATMAMLRWGVGLFRLGGVLYDHADSQFSGFSEPIPVATDEWLDQRAAHADWIGSRETFERKLVSLESQLVGFAASPLLMDIVRWGVGLARTGGILYNHMPSSMGSYFEPGEPVGVDGQWLVHRGLLSDWTGIHRTSDNKLAFLENQLEGFCPNPLPFGMLRFPIGLIRLGGLTYPDIPSRTTIATAEDDLLLDALSTEEFSMIVTEDTGEPLGLG